MSGIFLDKTGNEIIKVIFMLVYQEIGTDYNRKGNPIFLWQKSRAVKDGEGTLKTKHAIKNAACVKIETHAYTIGGYCSW